MPQDQSPNNNRLLGLLSFLAQIASSPMSLATAGARGITQGRDVAANQVTKKFPSSLRGRITGQSQFPGFSRGLGQNEKIQSEFDKLRGALENMPAKQPAQPSPELAKEGQLLLALFQQLRKLQ